jgi:hypothetical protein
MQQFFVFYNSKYDFCHNVDFSLICVIPSPLMEGSYLDTLEEGILVERDGAVQFTSFL